MLSSKYVLSYWLATGAFLASVSCGGAGTTVGRYAGSSSPEPQSTLSKALTPGATLAAMPTVGGNSSAAANPPPANAKPPPSPLPKPVNLTVEAAFLNLPFTQLTNLAQPDDGSDRLFVSEQHGRVLTFPAQSEVTDYGIYLNISDQVSQGNNEEGLLGLAFDPAFDSNGYFFLYYSASNPRRSVLSRFTASGDNSEIADELSELIVLEVPQPAGNHNGGQLAFGPDGMLYLGLGDGGRAGDPVGNGQDLSTLLGAILRLDVSGATLEDPYRVPADNPFAGEAGITGARGEIWAYGFRNPWRFSFDKDNGNPESGGLWVGDVGQNSWEEVDLVERGGNYGWNVMEGAHCFPPGSGCDESGFELPVAEYSGREGCSVIGGYVYQGDELPFLEGTYLYADFCSGDIWGLHLDGRDVLEQELLIETGLNITSFGEDQANNLYVLDRNDGIYRLAAGE